MRIFGFRHAGARSVFTLVLIAALGTGGIVAAQSTASPNRRVAPDPTVPSAPLLAVAEKYDLSLGTLPAGESITVELDVLVNAAGALLPPFLSISNQATVTSGEISVDTDDPDTPALGDPTLSITDSADLSITVTDAPDPVAAGTNLTYTVTVANAGPQQAENVVATDTLPAGVTLVSTSGCAEDPAGAPTCSLGTITAGTFKQYTVTVAVAPSTTGMLTNQASVVSSRLDGNPSNNTASATSTVTSEADISIAIADAPDPVVAGTNLSYTITVSNGGPSNSAAITVTNTLPAGVTLMTSAGCVEDPNGVPTCNLDPIAAGASAQFILTVTVDPSVAGGSVLSNQAAAASATTDPNPSNNTATEETTVNSSADLSIAKADSVDPASPGSPLDYTITVGNAGPSAAANVVVTDTLPAGVTLVSTTGCTEDPNGVPTCNLGSMAPGATVYVTVGVTVDIGTTGPITNLVSVSSDSLDPDETNNSASEETSLDIIPPTVTELTVLPEGGGSIFDPCGLARTLTRGFAIDFSEEMFDPPGDDDANDVTNPLNYLVVGAGADEDLSTEICGSVFDDDIAIDLASVTWDPDSDRALLDADETLAGSLYRLAACATLQDLGANPLDGDGDGTGGDDFVRTFRLDPGNAFVNGHFDCSADGWDLTSSTPGEISHSSDDSALSSLSGSLEFRQLGVNTFYEAAQCAVIGSDEATGLSGAVRVAAEPGVLLSLTTTCTSYPEPDCTGEPVGSSSQTLLMGDSAELWNPVSLTVAASTGRSSVRCVFSVSIPSGDDFTLSLDRLFLDVGDEIFADGFESGDTSAWSAEEGGI